MAITPKQEITLQEAVESARKPKFEVLPKYQPSGTTTASGDMCIVLHGYGRLAPTYIHYVDTYKFIGGVGYNIPKLQAEAWKNGTTIDGKPAPSRVFPQAILPSDATEVDFASATGIAPMEPARLAAMINATDARALVTALGRKAAVELAEELLKNTTA